MEDQRAAVAGDPVRRRERWVGFAFLMTGMFLVVADQTVTVVVIPDVVDDLGVDVAAGTLLVTLYLVVAASSMVLMGRVADIVGRRRVVVIALVVFALASVLCGLAPSYEVLLAGRIVQGWTLGAYVPASLGMLNVVFPPGDADRVRAYAVFSTIVGAGLAAGPIVGGVLATEASWRWAFLVMVPVALGGVVGVRATIGESREPGADRRLDVAGALLLMTGVGCIVFALQEGGPYGWWRAREADPLQAFAWTPAISPIPILLAVGITALVALWIVEGRREATGWPVMLNRRLLGVRSFRDGELTVSTMSVAFYGSLLIIPIYTQFVLGYGALASGGIVFAIGGGIVVGGLAATWLSGRLGDRRAGLSAVALQAVAAIALAATVGHGPGWLLAFPLLVLGVGFGVALALLSGLLMSQVPAALASLAAGTSTTIRNVTQALGAALLTAVLLGTAVSDVRDRLDTMPAVSAADRRTIEQAADFSSNAPPLNRASGQGTQTIAELREEPALRPAIDALDGAFATATRTALGVSAGLAILALLIGLRIPRPEHDAATAPEARDTGAGAPESVGPPPESPGSRTGGDHPPSPEGR